MSRTPSPTVRRRRLGVELRRLREAAGLTGDQVVERVGWASSSKISRIENGRSRPGLADVLALLDLYRVTGRRREQLLAIARDAGNSRGWLRAYPVMTKRQRGYAELEAGCSQILEYGQLVVPGLLQAPGYARWRILGGYALSETPVPPPGELDTEVAARTARQGLLLRKTDPPRYEAVLEEWAFTARAGPADVLADQLEHLCRLADLPNVTLRLLPPNASLGDWYTPATSFSIYQFTDPDDPGTVGVEALGHDVLLPDHPALRAYLRVFDWLREAARPVEESRRWLTDAAAAARSAATSSPSPDGETAGPGRQTGGGETAGRGGPGAGGEPAARSGADRHTAGGEPAARSGADRHTAGGEPAARSAAAPTQRGPQRRRVEPRPG